MALIMRVYVCMFIYGVKTPIWNI